MHSKPVAHPDQLSSPFAAPSRLSTPPLPPGHARSCLSSTLSHATRHAWLCSLGRNCSRIARHPAPRDLACRPSFSRAHDARLRFSSALRPDSAVCPSSASPSRPRRLVVLTALALSCPLGAPLLPPPDAAWRTPPLSPPLSPSAMWVTPCRHRRPCCRVVSLYLRLLVVAALPAAAGSFAVSNLPTARRSSAAARRLARALLFPPAPPWGPLALPPASPTRTPPTSVGVFAPRGLSSCRSVSPSHALRALGPRRARWPSSSDAPRTPFPTPSMRATRTLNRQRPLLTVRTPPVYRPCEAHPALVCMQLPPLPYTPAPCRRFLSPGVPVV